MSREKTGKWKASRATHGNIVLYKVMFAMITGNSRGWAGHVAHSAQIRNGNSLSENLEDTQADAKVILE